MSNEICETVQIQGEKSEDNPTGVVIINKSDLTDEMIVVGESVEPVLTAKELKAKAKAVAEEQPKTPWTPAA